MTYSKLRWCEVDHQDYQNSGSSSLGSTPLLAYSPTAFSEQLLEDLAKWTRSPRRIFKARPSKNGTALSIQLRLAPKLAVSDKGQTYVDLKQSGGGLFLDIVPQAQAVTADGHATFDWKSDKAVTAGLGTPDISKMIVSYRRIRFLGKQLPASYQNKNKPDGLQLSLFHQTPGGGSCAISWSFAGEGSTLSLSRSKDQRQSISLTLDEEVVFVEYLERSLEAFNDLGY